jgi:hypothetical protein
MCFLPVASVTTEADDDAGSGRAGDPGKTGDPGKAGTPGGGETREASRVPPDLGQRL